MPPPAPRTGRSDSGATPSARITALDLPGLRLGVLDLLEDFAHARAHEVTCGRVGIAITASGSSGLARVEVVIANAGFVGHGRIVGPRDAVVNASARLRAVPKADEGNENTLKRERAGTYRTRDGRFTVEQSSSGWMLLDAEQTNELGLQLTRGPFATLEGARDAIVAARSGPTSASFRAARRGSISMLGAGPPATPNATRRAPRRADPAALVIRELRMADGEALRALWKAAGFRSLGDDDKSLARLARRNPGLALVATESGRIVGSALGAWDGRRGWIYHVTTASSHRRAGVARRLVEQVERGLRDLGAPKINVVVRPGGEGGPELWKELGYKAGDSRLYGKELDAG